MENLSNGQKIALGGGILLLISSFLPWYGVDLGVIGGVNIKAWDAGFLAWGGVVLGVAGAALIALKAFQDNAVSAGGFATEQLALILAGIGAVLIILRFITETSFVKFGLFIGVVAAAATAYGAYQSMNEQGMSMDQLKGQLGDAAGDLKGRVTGDDDDEAAPPPPPPPVE